MPKVSIVLLNLNGEKFSEIWKSIFNQTYSNYEIIFVDNGSNDQSVKAFQELSEYYHQTSTTIIQNKSNIGYSPANNIGFSHSTGEYIFLLSNDVELDKDCIKELVNIFDTRPEIGVAQCMMYSLFNKSQPDAMFNYLDVLGFNHLFLKDRIPEDIAEVFYSEGAAFFTRRQLIEQVGLFDDDYFMLFEDIDYCWKIKLLGKKSVVIMNAKTYHARGGTIAGVIMKSQPKFVQLNTRNRLATLYKNYGTYSLVRYMPLTIVIELIEAIWLITHGKRHSGLAVINGILKFVSDWKQLRNKRRFVQSKRIVDEDQITSQLKGVREAIANLRSLSAKLETEWSNRSIIETKYQK